MIHIHLCLFYLSFFEEMWRQPALSQRELSDAIEVSFPSVKRWENGKMAPSKLAFAAVRALL